MASVTTVGTSVQRVLKDDAIIPSHKSGALKAIFAKGNFGDYIMEEIVGGLAFRGDKYFKYGAKKYAHGNPTGEFLSDNRGRREIQAIIERETGSYISIDYCHLGPVNYLHMAWEELCNTYSYNPATNKVVPPNYSHLKDIYVSNISLVVPSDVIASANPESFIFHGVPAGYGPYPTEYSEEPLTFSWAQHRPIVNGKNAPSIVARVEWVFYLPEKMQSDFKVLTGTIDIPLVDADPSSQERFHVRYRIGNAIYYRTIHVSTTQYPELDAALKGGKTLNATFYPFSYVRYAKTAVNEDKTSVGYKTGKKLLKTLNIDFDQLADAINENPDIKDVEQAMLVFALPANTENKLEIRYLYEFFERLFYAGDGRYTNQDDEAIKKLNNGGSGSLSTRTKNEMIIKDKLFKLTLSNDGIYKKHIVGSIGPIGTYTTELSSITESYQYSSSSESQETSTKYFKTSLHIYRKQTATGIYEEISVRRLLTKFRIFCRHMEIGNDSEPILLVPLDRAIVKTYGVRDREMILSRGMHYVFNSRVYTKLKWYQTAFFQFVMIVVSIVITVVTFGSSWMATGAALAAGTITVAQLAMSFLIGVMKHMITGFIFRLFIKIVGVEAAFLIAILGAIAGVASKTKMFSLPSNPWSENLLSISNGLLSGIQETVKKDFMGLEKDFNDFSKFTEDALEELESVNDLLKQNNSLAPLIVFGESPDNFFNRTTHAGNIGTLGFDAIHNFVETSLALPTFSDTYEGFKNV